MRHGGFDRRLSTSADGEILARLLLVGPTSVLEEPLILYCQHGNIMHQNVAVMEHDMLMAFDRIFEDQRLDPALRADECRFRAILHKVLAGSYYATDHKSEALRHWVRAIRLDPRSLSLLFRITISGLLRKSSHNLWEMDR